MPTQEVLLSKGAISVRASSKKRGKAKITVTLAGKKTTLLIQVT
ncbi:MAG: bacterial Ig-like domain-containing protein [Micrococcales bacterium]|nr:bacterial Ig-like domain-containing protein [Micrococcales bacterium]